jgi:Ca-activated chloride channel homolog
MSPRETRKPRLFPAGRPVPAGWLLLGLLAALQARAEPFGLELRDADGGWQPSLAMDTAIRLQVTGLVAEVTVTQRYENRSPHWQEGRYLLPLPAEAAVGALRIRIGERLIEGEVQEKQQARQTYEQAAASGQRTALVEQDRPNLFRTAVANIGPGETVEIEIGYWQRVDFRDGAFQLALPLTLTPRYRAGGSALDEPTGILPIAGAATPLSTPALEPSVSLEAVIDPGLPLASLDSPTHEVEVTRQGDQWNLRLSNFVEASDRDLALEWRPAPSAIPQRALFTEAVDGQHYAMLMLLPPDQPVAPVPRELLLVIDHSGSMLGTSMDQAIAALDDALGRLRPDERFNVIRFNHSSEAFVPAAVPASPANVLQARQWVQALRADGGTEMAPALQRALATPATPGFLRQLVLITDAAVGNENELLAQIEQQRGDTRVFTVGIGSAPNEHFIRRAAEAGRGSFALIRDIAGVSRDMGALMARIDRPLLRDVAVDWPVAAEAYPARVPDLYAGEPLLLLARVDGLQGQLKVRGQGRHQAWTDGVNLALGKHSPGRGIGRLWGRARLQDLQDSLRHGADPEQVRNASLEVALPLGLASAYTSLVAVERTPVRPLETGLASTTIPNATPAGSLAMAQGSTPATRLLGWAIALLLMAGALLRTPTTRSTTLG